MNDRELREMVDETDEHGIPLGMYEKYVVYRVGSDIPVKDAFVLAPSKDYHARVALAAYIESVRYFNEQLASDLEEFLVLTMPEGGVEELKMRPD